MSRQWHATLKASGRRRGKGGVSSRTVVHAHRVLCHALDDAMRHGVVARNVAKLQPPPRVQASEMAILDRDGIDTLLTKLPGHEMYAQAIAGLFTGMRLGEVLALRWRNVDLDGKVIQVREAVEETKAHGIQVKPPKTRAGRRDIGLPDDRGQHAARSPPAAARTPHGARRRQDARSTRSCSRPSREASGRPATSPGHGGSSPMLSGCRRSRSTA